MAYPARSEGGRPPSIEELSERASRFEFNPSIGFKYWAHAAETIWHEAQVAFREDDLASTYVFLMRYSLLVLNHLRSHPEAKSSEAKRTMKPLISRVEIVIEFLEQLRPQLEKAYKEWETMRSSASERTTSRQRSSSRSSTRTRKESISGWGAPTSKFLDPVEHKDVAVELAKKEMNRRRTLPGLSSEEVSRRRTAGIWSLPKPASSPISREMPDDDLRRQMEATRRQLDRNQNIYEDEPLDRRTDQVRTGSYNYPTINKSSSVQYSLTPPTTQHGTRSQPPRPPKESLGRPSLPYTPPLPAKEPPSYNVASPVPPPYNRPTEMDTPPIPPKHASTPVKEKRITFKPVNHLENGDAIRPVFLPETLQDKFLQLAAKNTEKKLEMCGLLCGTLVNGGIFVTTLLIPEQTCTPDTCETTNEEATLDYCIKNDVFQVGWIHTHPTQSCFMSSRDIHTHAYYQTSFPEAIAIVCSPDPRYNEVGIFRLTNPPGLGHILGCSDRTTFHQHSIDNIYTMATHVIQTPDLEYEVFDLRPKH